MRWFELKIEVPMSTLEHDLPSFAERLPHTRIPSADWTRFCIKGNQAWKYLLALGTDIFGLCVVLNVIEHNFVRGVSEVVNTWLEVVNYGIQTVAHALSLRNLPDSILSSSDDFTLVHDRMVTRTNKRGDLHDPSTPQRFEPVRDGSLPKRALNASSPNGSETLQNDGREGSHAEVHETDVEMGENASDHKHSKSDSDTESENVDSHKELVAVEKRHEAPASDEEDEEEEDREETDDILSNTPLQAEFKILKTEWATEGDEEQAYLSLVEFANEFFNVSNDINWQ